MNDPKELDPRSPHGFGKAEDLVPEHYVELEENEPTGQFSERLRRRWLRRG